MSTFLTVTEELMTLKAYPLPHEICNNSSFQQHKPWSVKNKQDEFTTLLDSLGVSCDAIMALKLETEQVGMHSSFGSCSAHKDEDNKTATDMRCRAHVQCTPSLGPPPL